MSDLESAVGVALAEGATKEAVRAGIFRLSGEGEFIASDFFVNMLIDTFAVQVSVFLSRGEIVSLAGFGTFYTAKSPGHVATGAVEGWIPARKVPRIKFSPNWVVGMPETEGEPGDVQGG